MTICIQLEKLDTKILCDYTFPFFSIKEKEMVIKITWISYGIYQLNVYHPNDLENDVINFKLTLELINEMLELYPKVRKRKREKYYNPFLEQYITDRSMFDMTQDVLFQAFKNSSKDHVYMTNLHFSNGVPSTFNRLNMKIEELKKLKEHIENTDALKFNNIEIQ